MKAKAHAIVFLCLLLPALMGGQELTVSARVALDGARSKKQRLDGVVLWLTSEDRPAPIDPSATGHPRLVQRNKAFEPHIQIVPVGSVVAFPNRDPFFHNVFSLFEGKRFDLGLYETGSSRDVRFDKVGVSYIFCNIHPEMGAVIISLDTPYHGISDSEGEVILPRVPAGKYVVHLWYEGALPETLRQASREISVNENNATLGVFRLPEPMLSTSHKNLYGRDYDPTTPANPAYARP